MADNEPTMQLDEPTMEPEIIHRLKNHLCIITGFCELLILDWPEEDPRQADILEIQRAANAALAMMPDLANRLR